MNFRTGEGSAPETVLRRAASISVVRECVRRRERMRPDKRQEFLKVARTLHARELAAERRRQRHRKAAASVEIKMFRIRSPWSNSNGFGERDRPQTSGDLRRGDEHSVSTERAEKTSF